MTKVYTEVVWLGMRQIQGMLASMVYFSYLGFLAIAWLGAGGYAVSTQKTLEPFCRYYLTYKQDPEPIWTLCRSMVPTAAIGFGIAGLSRCFCFRIL